MSEKLIEYLVKESDYFSVTEKTIEKFKEFLLIHPEITEYTSLTKCLNNDGSNYVYTKSFLQIGNSGYSLVTYLAGETLGIEVVGDIVINHKQKVCNFIDSPESFDESVIQYHLHQKELYG